VSEIARLRSEGYTCEAIRSALADAGVNVSLSTVQREAARSQRRKPLSGERQAFPVPIERTPAVPPSVRGAPDRTEDRRTGKEIAAEFVGKCITNPLLQQRSNHENRGN
jgi:hypothetical protein